MFSNPYNVAQLCKYHHASLKNIVTIMATAVLFQPIFFLWALLLLLLLMVVLQGFLLNLPLVLEITPG